MTKRYVIQNVVTNQYLQSFTVTLYTKQNATYTENCLDAQMFAEKREAVDRIDMLLYVDKVNDNYGIYKIVPIYVREEIE